jgi:isovaleryl-CoA dehydrogenase
MSIAVATTDERVAFVEAIRDYVRRKCASRAQWNALTNDGEDAHNAEMYEELASLGWVGCCFPEKYGGGGGTVVDACLFREETNFGQLPLLGTTTSMIVGKTVENYGTDQQKDEIIGAVCRGEVMSVSMSEPGAGSDVAALTCRAERRDGGFVINGQKTWCSNAQHAARIMLICRTARGARKHDGITMLDVPADVDGLEIRPIETMGGREVNDLFFDNAFVPDSALIGEENQAWTQLMAGLNFERLISAAAALGLGRRAFDDALAFVREREQFGRPVGSFQTIKHRIADLATELECCRTLLYDVARRAEERPEVQMMREASMVKLKTTETARRIAIEGMQMMGGYGYATEYPMERHLRSTIYLTVAAGTSEIQREIIGKTYGL